MDLKKEQKKYIINNYQGQKPLPTNNFYEWNNYDWLKTTIIPDDKSSYNNFIHTQININNKLKKIIEFNLFPLGTILYNSYINTNYKNTKCLDELKELLKIIDDVDSYKTLIQMSIRLLFINVNTLFIINIDANIYSSCNNIMYISQSTLGLPDRAYYHDIVHQKIRQKYYNTICELYKELYPELTNKKINLLATLIINIEKKLSIIFISETNKRDISSIYHKITLEKANIMYPGLYLNSIIEILCLLTDNKIIEQNFINIIMEHHNDISINYFKQLENLLLYYTIEEWKEYFRFRIILSYMNITNQTMKDLYFNMFIKTIKGQKNQKLLSESALSFTCHIFNDKYSKIYTDIFYKLAIETYMIEMVSNIKKATKDRILNLDWMSDITKKKAILKLHRMKLKLGYTTHSRLYNHIVLTDSIIKNTIILNRDNMIYNLNKLNQNINPDNWDTSAFIVNAYYHPTLNQIIFPTAILQPPFIDLSKSDIYNYGHIGSIIGHEIIHSFDDQGSKFDENGSINDWWLPEDKIKYNEKVAKIIEIYDTEGINGKLTTGENIADFGAITMALYGLKYKLNNKLNINDIKEFYKAYASNWRYLIKPELVEIKRLTDNHAFADLRVNIPLQHQKIFHQIFKTKPGDKMYKKLEDILYIW